MEAEAAAEIAVVEMWQKATPDNWQACRDFLARRYPERWAREAKEPAQHQHLHVSVEGNAVLDFDSARELIESRRRVLLDMASVRDDEETAFRSGTLKALDVPAVRDGEAEDG